METENKDKGIQIMKFHNYVQNRYTFSFSVFFFFLGISGGTTGDEPDPPYW